MTLKNFMQTKTHWQKMLKNEINASVDLIALQEEMKSHIPSELKQYLVDDSQLLDLSYSCS